MEVKAQKIKKKAKNSIQNKIENNEDVVLTNEIEMQNNAIDLPVNIIEDITNPDKTEIKDITESKKKIILSIIPWVLLVIFLVISFFIWFQMSDLKKDPLKIAQAEINEVINNVGRIMILPKGETPKMATLTIDDVNKLKTQSFFANAEVGDKVLVYSIARKVILYDPKINKIVEVANLDSTTGNQPSPSSI